MFARALVLLVLAAVPLPGQIKIFTCDFGSEHPHPQISVGRLLFHSAIRLPAQNERDLRNRIALNGGRVRAWKSAEELQSDAEELVREAYQDEGYFKASVQTQVRHVADRRNRHVVDLIVQVEPGKRYRLSNLILKGNSGISTEELAKTMPIHSGEIFSRRRIAKGIDSLKRLYDSHGYINASPVPYPTFNEAGGTVAFEIDIDEGEQFHFGDLDVTGMRGSDRQILLSGWKKMRGQTYNQEAADRFFRHWFKPLRAGISPRNYTRRHIDNRTLSVSYSLALTRYASIDPAERRSAPRM